MSASTPVAYSTPPVTVLGQRQASLSRGRGSGPWHDGRLLAGAVILSTLVAIAVLAPLIAPHDPLKVFPGQVLKAPSGSHWLGTDELGRSLASRLIYGARVSLGVAFAVVAIAAVAGTVLGIVAAYWGGVLDMAVMRVMDLIQSLPQMILIIAVVAFMGSALANLILVIGVLSIPGTARIVYTTALTIRQMQYVEAAHAVGAGAFRVMLQHMLPNALAPLLVHVTLSLGFVILTESGLSFLGLGPPPPTPTWGQMIAVGRNYIHRQPLPVLAPMVAVSVVILGLNVLGDALRDLLDPRLRTERARGLVA